MPNEKQKLETLMAHFGPCRCENACQVEQFSDERDRNKPGGRFSVCELDAEKHGIKIPKHEDE